MNKPIFTINDTKLFKEKNLVIFDIPLMFTCVDEFGKRYIVLLVDEETDRYILVSSDNEKLHKMLTGSISMHDFFATAEKKWSITAAERSFDDCVQEVDTFLDDDLPVPGVAYQVENEEIADFIRTLKSELDGSYVEFSILPTKYSIAAFLIRFVQKKLLDPSEFQAFDSGNYYTSPKFEISY